jgi:hypothetical protein
VAEVAFGVVVSEMCVEGTFRPLPEGRQPRAGRGDGVRTIGAGVRANVADPVTDAKNWSVWYSLGTETQPYSS